MAAFAAVILPRRFPISTLADATRLVFTKMAALAAATFALIEVTSFDKMAALAAAILARRELISTLAAATRLVLTTIDALAATTLARSADSSEFWVSAFAVQAAVIDESRAST